MRLLETIRCDVRLQYRNGFYYAVAFLLFFFAILVNFVPIDWTPWLAALLLGNMMLATFFFLGGLILLEKGEGTLEALIVTPLSDVEYLASKIVTLTLLATAEQLMLVLLASGFDFSPLPLLIGVVLGSILYCLFGFLAVSRYDSINEYLFPSMLYTLFFSVPFIPFFGLADGWAFYLHPLQGVLLLLGAAFVPLSGWQWVYSLGSCLLWSFLLLRLCRLWFHRFIIRSEGVR